MAEAAAHAAAIARAIRASGVVVRVEPPDFLRVLNRQDEPIVVRAPGGFFQASWRYLTTYKGLAFFAAMLADFRAVAELGWIAGCGVLLCALACFTVLPALVMVFDRRAVRGPSSGGSGGSVDRRASRPSAAVLRP